MKKEKTNRRKQTAGRGQALVEYVLMVSIFLGLAMTVFRLMYTVPTGRDMPVAYSDYQMVRVLVKPPYWDIPDAADWIGNFFPSTDLPFWDLLKEKIFGK